jgi:hypothetical protein
LITTERAAHSPGLVRDFVIIQQIAEDSISNASRTVAGVCGPLVSLRRVQWDALCVGIIEVSSVRSDIFFERSCDVVSFEKLSNLESPDILWEGFHGASSLPTLAIRGLRAHATKILILNLSVTLFQQGKPLFEWKSLGTDTLITCYAAGQAIFNLIDGLAEHNITLVHFLFFFMIFLMPHRFLLQFSQLGRMHL